MVKTLEERLERAVLSRSTLNKLRVDIILKKYQPGSRLIETQLAAEYGVSRGRVREILAVLEQEGIVESLSNGGTVVVDFTEKIVADMYDLRIYFETKALEIILNKPIINYGTLVSVLDMVAIQPEKLDIHNLFEIDIKFHRSLFIVADNRPLLQCWSNLASVIYTVLSINASTEYSKNYVYEFYEKHKVIIDQIIKKDSGCIEKITEHIVDARRMTLDIIRSINS